jgi:hypothetical protein
MNSARILTVDPANPIAGNFKKLLRAMSTKEITGWSIARNLGRREEIRFSSERLTLWLCEPCQAIRERAHSEGRFC